MKGYNTRLRDICLKITKGTTPTTLGCSFSDGGINFIKAESVTLDGRIDESKFAFIDEATDNKLKRSRIENKDILFSIAGMKLGKVAVVKKRHLPANTNQALAIVRLDNTKAIPEYIYYIFLQPWYYKLVNKITAQAAQPNINLTQLGDLPIKLPALGIQEKIVSILSSYDDLIENNTRRIQILEEMAQRIYREWFVHFRFPGHENVKMVESELGMIPAGWAVKLLGDLTEVITKGTTPTTLGKPFQDEGINFIKVESIDSNGGILDNKLAKIDAETHEILKRSQIHQADILFSIAGAIGRSTIIPKRILPANTNQALAIIRPSDSALTNYLYQNVRSADFLTFSLGRVVQTAQANVSLSVLSSAPILVPKDYLIKLFNGLTVVQLEMIEKLRQKNINLRKTIDLLLPKLISGQIDVSDLDIDIGEEAA